MVTFLCPVRGCGEALALGTAAGMPAVCPRGHSFDRARSGYWNLLQPQDRRSLRAGDAREVVLARRRFLAAGHEEPFVLALVAVLGELDLPPRPAVLDVGCGTGYHLGALMAAPALGELEAHGLDLSVPAIELAARSQPGACFVVANADRFLPYAAGAFAVALSLTSRRYGAELARVLRPAGFLVAALPGPEDLLELRSAVLGAGTTRDRGADAVAALASDFALAERRRIDWTVRLTPEEARDALAATYRGVRQRESARAAALGEMEVRLSRDLLVFRR